MLKEGSFIPYGRQSITEGDIEKVVEVLKSPLITQGPLIKSFETELEIKTGASYSVAVNSATSALHIACLSLGLGDDDWLWTSSITFVASANCALYCRAKIDFIDIDPSTGLISIQALENKLKEAEKAGKLPKIIIPVHLAGTSCDMERLSRLSKKYGFFIIEDASHAIGGRYQNQPVGNCRFSSITIFSFHPVKIITTGEGGALTTNDNEIYQKLIDLRSHGITKDKNRFTQKPNGPWSYEQQSLGYNYRITDFQCALGLNQLKRLDEIIFIRNKLLSKYKKLLFNLPIEFLKIPESVYSSVHLCIIKLNNKDPDFHRNIFEYMLSSDIGVQLHYSPVHLQPYYRKLGFKKGYLPFAESYASNSMSLPLFPGLSEENIIKVVTTLQEAIK